MKKILVISLCMLLAATSAFAVIAGSKHDLTSATYYTGATKSSCAFCHTPHHAVASTAPLWNRSTSAATYNLYGGGSTLAGSTVNNPGANSQTCLSCHDGTIDVGDVVNGTNDTIVAAGVLDATGKILGTAAGYIGTNLTTTHPIGVIYNTAKTLAGLNSTISGGTNPTINGKNWKIYGGGDGVGRIECGSCHDPHNTTAGQTPFLKDAKLTICADCHSAK